MATRAGVALFGDMGIEANLLDMDKDEKAELTAAVALHKQHRQLIHSGELVRLDTQDFENSFGIVAEDREEALFSYTLLASSPNTHAGRLHFSGLNPDRLYTVDIIWPLKPSSSSPSILDRINGAVISGDALIHAGLQLPIMQPETLLVFHLQQN